MGQSTHFARRELPAAAEEGEPMARIAPAERREELTRAALAVFLRDGIQGVTTRAVVQEAGMSLASLHYVFASRDELLRALVEQVVQRERGAALAGLPAARPRAAAAEPLELVRGALAGFLDLVRADPVREQAMFELTQYALREPGLRDLPALQYRRYHETAEALITAAAEDAGVVWRIPAEELARLVIALTDGVTLAWLATRDDEAAERLLDLAAAAIAAHAEPRA
ncbi:TetR/AcrR family transcriptional regulator [Homoserinibacter sp. YIM 151385]|uniref:TetR/AcrR family transcriptional regulator n=1 Tax=Homoserinibacter sp. YIM 151385 TaxID=2985506 RepID=UPI0022F12895|nr:TetR family transcriptional regulator C-terminal domain-containing protein [Homoserinibacter sp. YIM 151385]WBU38053.1 TetR family transcriptional regulator C-terminal domain-containing protein [Homoserinibacter sp. YIM 151385]